ncbi:type 4 pilus major pilin [Iodobacter fluviatilis]|uniref:Prepilin-type N-terminal cleavage/methylation domain-containing protein n=1 Tax=Iodobacter fluviatilis TaxID=537 RepID=A0A377Q5Q1_9NEIS|nr:type 4 pilus major pilin [Iodobacter fluviatilis]TCU84622.1 prepilin-type N-terminal cleavage/methylation domain-containing protein [Iodobacter fluviatilis]STQ90088.1 Tfp pilus assembly protein PilV [Iodobacter fluviatilis]
MKYFNKKQTGYTLIEIMIAMVIISIIVGGLIMGFKMLKSGANVDREAKKVSLIQASLVKYTTNNVDTQGIDTTTVINLKSVPDETILGGNKITNRFGGETTIAPDTLTNANDAINITNNGMNKEQCIEYGKTGGASYEVIKANGTTVKARTETKVNETINAACIVGTTNSVSFIFGKG